MNTIMKTKKSAVNWLKKMDTLPSFAEMDKNFKNLVEIDLKSKESGTLVGRLIKEPFADGYAFYQITKETKNKCKIRVCTGIGDDWIIPYWGAESTIDKDYIVKSITINDKLNMLFGGTR